MRGVQGPGPSIRWDVPTLGKHSFSFPAFVSHRWELETCQGFEQMLDSFLQKQI